MVEEAIRIVITGELVCFTDPLLSIMLCLPHTWFLSRQQ